MNVPLQAEGQKTLSDWKGTAEVKNGVRIVSNPAQPLFGEFDLDVERDLVIGDAGDENSRFFYRVSIAVDSAGHIYVYDYRSYRIQKYGPDGKFIQTIGKQGQGPGEFQGPEALWCDKRGNLQVVDLSRVHIFDGQGRFLKSIPTMMSSRQAVVMSNGNMLRVDREFGPRDFLEGVVLTDELGKVIRSLARYKSQKMDVMFKQKPRFIMDFPEIILSPWTSDLALFAYPSDYVLTAVNGRGEVVLVIQKEGRPEQITRRDKDLALERIIAQYPKEKERRDELERRTSFPKYRPFFDKIQGDEGGGIYVRRLRADSDKVQDNDFDIFDQEGRFLSTVSYFGDVCLLKGGYIFTREPDRESECVKLVRWKIRNWERAIKGGET